MEFFIPLADSDESRDQTYDGIKKHVGEEMGATFSDRRIYSISWNHDGKLYEAEVGKDTRFNGELVCAILYEPFRDLYHVCTINRGVLRGGPILAGAHAVKLTRDFE